MRILLRKYNNLNYGSLFSPSSRNPDFPRHFLLIPLNELPLEKMSGLNDSNTRKAIREKVISNLLIMGVVKEALTEAMRAYDSGATLTGKLLAAAQAALQS